MFYAGELTREIRQFFHLKLPQWFRSVRLQVDSLPDSTSMLVYRGSGTCMGYGTPSTSGGRRCAAGVLLERIQAGRVSDYLQAIDPELSLDVVAYLQATAPKGEEVPQMR